MEETKQHKPASASRHADAKSRRDRHSHSRSHRHSDSRRDRDGSQRGKRDRNGAEKSRPRKEDQRSASDAVQDAAQQQQESRRRFRSKKRHFLCSLPLRNRLPDPVPGAKLIQLPINLQTFVDFRPTVLDTDYQWTQHVSGSGGVRIDLVDTDLFNPASGDPSTALHPDDMLLVNWDQEKARLKEDTKQHAWLKKTVFITNDLSRASHMTGGRRQQAYQMPEDDQATLLEKAKKSFEAAKKDPKPPKPNLTMEWSIPLFPDTDLWANDYVQVSFMDDDPRNALGGAPASKRARVAQAMIVNARNEEIPQQQRTILKGSMIVPKHPTSDGQEPSPEPVPYEWLKQYQIERQDGHRNYLLFINEDQRTATFTEHRQSKIELKSGISTTTDSKDRRSKFEIRRRDLLPGEAAARRDRMSALEGLSGPPGSDDEGPSASATQQRGGGEDGDVDDDSDLSDM